MAGLRARCLLQSTETPDEGLSLTLWETLEDMEAYGASEERERLLPHLAHIWLDDEWPKGFEVVVESPESPLASGTVARIALGSVDLDGWSDYETVFRERIAATPFSGLLGRQLLRSVDAPNEGASVSWWASAQDLASYEAGDVYRRELFPLLRDLWVSHGAWQKALVVRIAVGAGAAAPTP